MFRVMLVDDFSPDLEKLKNLLKPFRELEIVATCSQGIEALEQIPTCRPDIILSDIDMPVMDGFELARNVRSLHPGIRIVFCSFHDEFIYAQKALYLDGYGYLLKPIDAQELSRCIKDLTEGLELSKNKEKRYDELQAIVEMNRPLLIQHFLNGLLQGQYKDTVEILEKLAFLRLEMGTAGFQLAYSEIDDFHRITNGFPVAEKEYLSEKVCRRILEHCGSCPGRIATRIDESHFAVIFHSDNMQPSMPGKNAVDFGNEVVQDFRKTDIGISCAISDSCVDFMGLNRLYEQCIYEMRYKYNFGKACLILASDIPYAPVAPIVDVNGMQKNFRFVLNSGTAQECIGLIEEVFGNLPADADPTLVQDLCFQILICIQTVLHEHRTGFQEVLGDERSVWQQLLAFETLVDVRDWSASILTESHALIHARSENRNLQLCEDLKKHVRTHFHRDINIDGIAEAMHFNADYLNHVFKETTGETIHDYLCRHKVELAKKMLTDTDRKLYEISDALGFSHAAYFGSFFRKYTGMTPREYRGSPDGQETE